jgi:hypothetical protein
MGIDAQVCAKMAQATRRMIRLVLLLALVSLACVAPATQAITPMATATATPEVIITPTVIHTFTALGTVYIRDGSGVVLDCRVERCALAAGDEIQCNPDGDWCWLDADRRVWAGCVTPNPQKLGCKPR